MSRMPRLLALLALLSSPALAQQVTYEARSLTPEAALKVASAALAYCNKQGYQAAVAVTDRSGNALVMLRDRLAGAHTVQTSIDKAYTAASFRMDTADLARETEKGAVSGIRHLPRVTALGGGLPIEAAGTLVGAIGVSGAPGGDADAACAKAGIDAIRDELEF
ncbi:MAG TPA: heme-binding protein [Burkholderiales bacterium]|nr:heme-binding protein [Burkholderiales bacterium]